MMGQTEHISVGSGNQQIQRYQGIDTFKWVAAFLVVAVHTSPLVDVSEMADFMLTRVLARLAVPFFFMVSGFFLFRGAGKEGPSGQKVIRFCQKTAILYGFAILLYLPLNLYAGDVQRWSVLSALCKDLLFNGTFYHLWYLPGVILGMAITWVLVRRLGWRWAMLSAFVLYGLGLLGDSYYGLTVQIPVLHAVYSGLFQVVDYTRNGLFFAPLFLMTGAWLARQEISARPGAREQVPQPIVINKLMGRSVNLNFTVCWMGFLLSLVLMSGEGILLHVLNLQRHDSMYVLLWPCLFFLFTGLLCCQGWSTAETSRSWHFQAAPLFLYLLHPAMIVVVRGLAKGIGMESLLIENSIMHFLTVSLSSLIVACGLAAAVSFWSKANRPKENCSHSSIGQISLAANAAQSRAWVEIHMDHLSHNVQVLQKRIPAGGQLMAVVKADAYGHGAVAVARHLNGLGIHHFAVATIDEGMDLRREGVRGEILVLGYTSVERIAELLAYDLCQTAVDVEHARQLNGYGKPVQIHLKIDTGMNRLGEPYQHVEEIVSVFQCEFLKIKGIFSHFSRADSQEEADDLFTRQQAENFTMLLEELKAKGIDLPPLHLQSSYGLVNHPHMNYDYVRVGIALYGALSKGEEDVSAQALDLRPALALKSRVAMIKTVAKGEHAGYGQSFTAQEDTKIALVPIGYADGVPRSLSYGKGQVLIHGVRVPIIGPICMDQLLVDVTALSEIKRGDVVTLIGRDGGEVITVEEMSVQAETITNELLSRLGQRVKKIVC